jgi:hypothetical protein
MDWQLSTTLVSVAFGVVGTVFGCWSFFWTRKHKLLDELSDILRLYVSGLRQLTEANNARRSGEGLRHSFPDGGTRGEAVKRANELVVMYNSLIPEAKQTCHNVEIEIAANILKFPDAIRKELSCAGDDLLRLGQLVNQGLWDAADVQAGCVKDKYRRIVRLGRGWRLRNPFKVMVGASENKEPDKIQTRDVASRDSYMISEPRMKVIMDLLHKRMTSQIQRSFAVHPPQKVIDNPELLRGEIDIDSLRDLQFKVAFQDGETQTLAFHELMVLTHELIFVAIQMIDIEAKLSKGGFSEATVEIKTSISPKDIMQPATVQALLEKIEFSAIPAEAI